MKRISLSFLLILIDITVLVVLFYLTKYIRADINDEVFPIFLELQLRDFYFVIFIASSLMFYEKIYTLRYDFWQETKKVMASLFYAYLVIMALLALTKVSQDYSRLFITLYFLLAIIILPIIKRFVKSLIYRIPLFIKKVYIVGEKMQVDALKKEFKKNWYLGMKYDNKSFDTVVITSKGTDIVSIKKSIEKYLENHTEVYIVPYVSSINFANSNIMEYSNIRYNTIQVENKLLLFYNLLIKNIFEYFLLLIIFSLFFLVHFVLTTLIRLDSKGGVFFKQHRLGKDNKDFVCYKYRTMHENSEKLLEEYLQEHPEEVAFYERYHKYKNDPRITKIGKLLRTTSLDELAQIINVFKGEMSLVGPRPYMTSESEKLGESQHFILKVKPGITGLWQVSGRNDLTFKERNELEVWYIKNWSLWADFVIIIKTIKVVLSKVGAK